MDKRKVYDWVEKYRPRSLSGVVGHPKGIEELINWGQSWRKGIPKDKAVLLYGRAGSGKTSSAYALANDMKWDVVELNASDRRTAKMLDKIAGAASQNATLNIEIETTRSVLSRSRHLILLDEADNLHGNADRGGEKAIIELIKKTTQPIILTANEYYDMSIGLRNACIPIQFSSIKIGTIIGILRKIADAEGVICGMGVLETIAEKANGDLRGAINDLQAIAEGKGRDQGKIKIDINDVKTGTGERDYKENIFKVLDKIFKGIDYIDAYESSFGLDQNPEDLINWIDENLPLEYTLVDELDKGYEYVSRASLFLGRVRRRQNYGMWRYAGFLMTGGVTVAKSGKHGGYTKFQTPSYWQKLGQTRGKRGVRDSVAKKIGKRCHISSGYVKSELFYFFKTLMKDERYNVQVASELGLEKEEIAFIMGLDLKSDIVNNIYDHSKLLIEEEKEHDIEIFGGFTKKLETIVKPKDNISIENEKSEERGGGKKLEQKSLVEFQKSLVEFQKVENKTETKFEIKTKYEIKTGAGIDLIEKENKFNKFYDDLFKLITGGINASKKGEIAAPINDIIQEANKAGVFDKDLIKIIEKNFKTRDINIETTKDKKFLIFKRK